MTVILPTLEGCGDELVETIRTILDNHPYELLLVTIDANRKKAENMLSQMPASKSRIRLFTVTHPNKRRQMTRAIPEVRTAITVFADDDVSWPRTVLPWILAPFEKDERYGGVVTCQRLRRAVSPTFSQRIWGFWELCTWSAETLIAQPPRMWMADYPACQVGLLHTRLTFFKTKASHMPSRMRSGGLVNTN